MDNIYFLFVNQKYLIYPPFCLAKLLLSLPDAIYGYYGQFKTGLVKLDQDKYEDRELS